MDVFVCLQVDGLITGAGDGKGDYKWGLRDGL